MTLAGGLAVGDRVICRGLPGTVQGGPARAACNRLSVAVRYDDGRIADERVVNLELLVEEPMPDEDDGDSERDYEIPPPMPPPAANRAEDQQETANSMWAQPKNVAASPPPAVFEQDQPSPADSPEDSRYDGRANGRDNDDGYTIQKPNFDEGAPGDGADQAEAVLREKIYANYEDLRGAFRALDESNNGYVSKEDFFQAMGRVFLTNGFSEDDVYEVADRFDLNRDGYISFQDFVDIVEGSGPEPSDADGGQEADLDDPRLVTAVDFAIQKFKVSMDQRYNSSRKAFLSLDADRSGAVTPQNFVKGLNSHGIYLSPPELELAWSVFDRNGTGQISYLDFCAVMTQRLQFGTHLNRQMFF